MCQINLIMRKDGLECRSINNVMNIISWFAWRSNNDGEGFIGRTAKRFYTQRSLKKLDYAGMQPFNLLISHQRFATSGAGINNAHPHESKNFILQHNGVFTGLGSKKISDTKIYLNKLQKIFDEEGDVIKSIQKVNQEVSGSYSIILYDKDADRLYYYKESSTSMFILNSKKYLFMSTSEQNIEVCKEYYNINNKITRVEPYIIYEITPGGLTRAGTFEYIRVSSGWSGWSSSVDYPRTLAEYQRDAINERTITKIEEEYQEDCSDAYTDYLIDCELRSIQPITYDEYKYKYVTDYLKNEYKED